jgi:hypothetical protein
MVLTATERATEIPPIRIPRMRQEANSTVAAEDRAACQIRTTAQDGIQRDLILTNKRTNTVALMPIRAKRKEFPDGYDKNVRFSVRMQIPLFMSSSYPFDANASSGRAGIFLWINTDDRRASHTTDSSARSYLSSHACPVSADPPCHTNRLLGKKSPRLPKQNRTPALLLPFQVVDLLAEHSPAQKAERHRYRAIPMRSV